MGGVVGEITGANRRAARAAGRAAQAQERVARENLAYARESRDLAVGALRGSPEEIRRTEAALRAQESNIAREEKLLASIDPALMEASTQALKLLRGEEASSVAPVRQQRERQRQMLLNSLREQFGPGAESSSAGVQALTAFDAETNTLMSNAQQGMLSGLFGATASILPSLSNARGRAAGQLSDTLFGRQQAMANAYLGGAQVAQQAGQGLQNAAGSQFVSSQLRGQQIQGIGSDLFRGALAYGSGGLSELGGFFGGGSSGGGGAGIPKNAPMGRNEF